jgi:hypothetical protein
MMIVTLLHVATFTEVLFTVVAFTVIIFTRGSYTTLMFTVEIFKFYIGNICTCTVYSINSYSKIHSSVVFATACTHAVLIKLNYDQRLRA